MYSMEYVTTYKGVVIYRNGFGEFEGEIRGLGFVWPTLSRARDAIKHLV